MAQLFSLAPHPADLEKRLDLELPPDWGPLNGGLALRCQSQNVLIGPGCCARSSSSPIGFSMRPLLHLTSQASAAYRLLRERLPPTTIVSVGHRSTLRALHFRSITIVSRGRPYCGGTSPSGQQLSDLLAHLIFAPHEEFGSLLDEVAASDVVLQIKQIHLRPRPVLVPVPHAIFCHHCFRMGGSMI